jgi:hypothetical protein
VKIKLFASAIAWSLLLTAPPAGAAPPPRPDLTLYVTAATFTDDCYVDGIKTVLGQGIRWEHGFTEGTSGEYDIRQEQGFWSFGVGNGDWVRRSMDYAGSFPQRCDAGPYAADQTVKVPPKVSRISGTTFKVRWAVADAPDAFRYTVRYRIGSGSYKVWKRGTRALAARFNARNNRTYHLQARTIKAGKASDWSPEKRFTT